MPYDQEIREAIMNGFGKNVTEGMRPSENTYVHERLPHDQVEEMNILERARRRGLIEEEPGDPMGIMPFRHSGGDPRNVNDLDVAIGRILADYERDSATQTPNQVVANEEQEFGDAEMDQFTEMLEAFKRGGGTPVVEMPTTTPRTAGPTRTPRTWRDY